MPFTPLHMGPGLAAKALAGRHFSVLTFGIAQVLMDIEPLIGLIRGADVLHGMTHTYLGALIIAALAAMIAPPICRPILKRWNRELKYCGWSWLSSPDSFERLPVLAGALVGTLSHVALDSIMHADMTPLAPWGQDNALLHLIPTSVLHQGCLVSGLFGIAGWLVLGMYKRRQRQTSG